ncbi:MAG: ABC transporter substrate-binding protein, partial [bacterium]
MNLKKAWSLGLFLVLALLLIWFLNSSNTGQTKTKVGVILPLTGPVASMGESARNGALLAFGDSSEYSHSSIIFEDDHFDPKTTILAYNKLKEIDKVTSIVCFASASCNAVAPLAEKDHILLMAVATDPLVQLDKQYVFRLEISPMIESQKISEYIKSKNYKSITSVVAIQSGVQAAYNGLTNDSDVNKLISTSESVGVGEKDYRTIISRLLKTKLQAIIVGLLPGDAGNFTKQARELGFGGDFIGFNFIEGEETLK